MTDDKSTPPEDSNMPNLTALLVICCCIIGVWGSSWQFINHYFSGDERGVVGDTFGAVNALFSGLAFSVLIYTMLLQRAELKLQRDELRETRAELAGQKEQMEIQNKTLLRQRFEQTFFNLLDTFSSSINSMEIREGGRVGMIASGRNCFQYQVQEIADARARVQGDIPTAMNRYLELHGSEISSYLSMFESILQFVESSDLTDGEKRIYVGFLGATLSTNEKVLLFYFGLSHPGQERIKGLLEKYNLLTDIYINQYVPIEYFNFYEASAFCRPPKVTAVA